MSEQAELNPLVNAYGALQKPGGVIAFPTDTVYGVGCLVEDEVAIERIYAMKNRPKTKPLVLLGRDIQAFEPYVASWPQRAERLATTHWPGPLTLVLPKTNRVPPGVTQGFPTVGVRVPQCQMLLDLLNLIPEGVLATTSANRSSEDPAQNAQEAREKLGDHLDYLLQDDGAVAMGQPSTVVAVEHDGVIQVLRTGSLVLE